MLNPLFRRMVAAVTAVLTLSLVANTGAAQEWTTKGGNNQRQSMTDAPLGYLGIEWWRMEDLKTSKGEFVGPGQSATQPIVVGDYAYHLAGRFLWKINVNAKQGQPEWQLAARTPVNDNPYYEGRPDQQEVIISGSTPTYSPETGVLYFGTGYGYLWAYDVRRDRLDFHMVSGCPIVTSPVVLRKDGRDIVIVGDKDDNCFYERGGRVWAVWGLDSGETAQKVPLPIGGWVTSSPVRTAADEFVIGADGVECRNRQGQVEGYGKAIKVKLVTDPATGGYALQPREWSGSDCIQNGQAGSFAATDQAVYWVDVNAHLYARKITDGKKPDAWPTHIDLPARIGGPGSRGFTNTEPAIFENGDALYVTLRNFTAPGDGIALRGCGSNYPVSGCPETGAPGAVIALKLSDGETKWARRMEIGPDRTRYDSINTAPLVATALGTVLFGDVNGRVHSFALTADCERNGGPCQGQRLPFWVDETCSSQFALDLLNPGEEADRGRETWSQLSGVGTDPMIAGGANPLLLIGVNTKGTDPARRWQNGRLVAMRAGDYYNLRWGDRQATPVGPYAPGQTITVNAEVALQFADQSLGQFRDAPVPIHWFVTPDKEQPGRLAAVTEALPGDLSAAGTAAIATQIQLSPTDPDEGFIKGVIDLPTLARFAGPDDFRTLKELEAAGLAGTPCPGQTRYELVFTADGLSQAKAYEDNKVWIEYRKQDLTNVRVQVEAPAAVEWEPEASYTATFRITNEGQSPVTVVTTADLASNTGSLSARLMTATLTLAPGETAVRTRSVPLAMCGETNTVTATVNPEPRAFAETTFADNQATARTTASACGEGAGHDSGRTMTVIVPADCIPNPDMESPRPCLNYDLTIPDRP